jgi:hypothetical protein
MMKLNQLAIFLIFLGIIILAFYRPSQKNIQAQEAPPEIENLGELSFKITLEISEEDDRSMADILWFQKAAEVAIKHKIPWFNVMEETITQDEVQGVIQLEPDPMRAEYDANEILSLQLEEEDLRE